MKHALLAVLLLLAPVCAAQIRVNLIVDGTSYPGYWIPMGTSVTVGNHTITFHSYHANPTGPNGKASFWIQTDGASQEFYHNVQAPAFSGHGSVTVTDSERATVVVNDPWSRSYTIRCPDVEGLYSGSQTFSVFPGNCAVKPYGDTENWMLWRDFMAVPGSPNTVDIPNIRIETTAVFSTSTKQVRMDVRMDSDPPVYAGGLNIRMDVEGSSTRIVVQLGSSQSIDTQVVCDSARTVTVRFFLGNVPIGSRNIDCVDDFTFGIFNQYGYSGFLTDSPDLSLDAVACYDSQIRLKVSGTDSPPVLRVVEPGHGFSAPFAFSALGNGYWEYATGIQGSMAEIRVTLPDGRTASSYCKRFGSLPDYTVRFMTDRGALDSVPYGTKQTEVCADLPAWMYGDIIVLSTNSPHVIASQSFTETTNRMCVPVNLDGLVPQKLKVVLMVWGGVNLQPMYLNAMLAIRPNEVHVFRGGCTMCKVGLASFPSDVKVLEHRPTDLDYLPKMLEYGIDFAPALAIPGEGRQYTLGQIQRETPSALEGMFRMDKANAIVFVPSYRSFDLVSALNNQESHAYELQGGSVVTYPVPGDEPHLGIIAIVDHLPRAVSISPSQGTLTQQSLDSLGPVCTFLSKICSAQGCSFDCVKYDVQANGTVTLLFSGALQGTVLEEVLSLELPDLEVNVTAPDFLLYGDTATMFITASDHGQPTDVVVVVETEGIGMTANKVAVGYYSLDVGPGEYRILVSRLGYRNYVMSRSIPAINPLNFTATVSPGTAGRTARAQVRVENVGHGKFWGVSTKVEIPALGARSVSAMDYDLDPFIARVEEVDVLIPSTAWPGEYTATITVGNAEFSNQENRTVLITSEDVLINLMKAVRDWYDRLASRG